MDCSVGRALDVLGEWWTLLVVREAFHGVRRFEGFVERLGIAPNILSARLRRLVEHGVLEPRKYSDHAERFEYRLTAKGRELFPIVVALMQWGDRWYADGGPPTLLIHASCEHAADPKMVCGHCAAPLDARETRAIPGPGLAKPRSAAPRTSRAGARRNPT